MQDRKDFGKQIRNGVHEYLRYRYKAPVQITPYLGRALVTVVLSGLNISEINNLLKLSTRRELTARCGLNDSQLVRVGWGDGRILVEAPLPRELRKPFDAKLVPSHQEGIWIGVNNFSSPTLLRTTKGKNVLVCGITQSGKTNLLKYLAYKLISSKEKVTILDASAKSDTSWQAFQGKVDIVTNTSSIHSFLKSTYDNLNVYTRQFIVIDELAALLSDSTKLASVLTQITAQGYGQGVTVVCATQYPSSKFLGNTTVSRNLGDRLCGMVDNANSSYNALGMAQGGAETLAGEGDFLYRTGDRLTRIYTPFINDELVSTLPDVSVPKKEVTAKEAQLELDLTDVHSKLDDILKAVNRPQQKELEPCEVAMLLKQPMTVHQIRTALRCSQSRAQRANKYIQEVKECLEKY